MECIIVGDKSYEVIKKLNYPISRIVYIDGNRSVIEYIVRGDDNIIYYIPYKDGIFRQIFNLELLSDGIPKNIFKFQDILKYISDVTSVKFRNDITKQTIIKYLNSIIEIMRDFRIDLLIDN